MLLPATAPNRIVHHAEALAWLDANVAAPGTSVVTSLPDVSERLSHGGPAFFIRDKKTFVMFHDDHHGDGILGIWCAAPAGVQATLIDADPSTFYRPAYVGHRGWLGVRLDRDLDPDELDRIIEDAWRWHCRDGVSPAAPQNARLGGRPQTHERKEV